MSCIKEKNQNFLLNIAQFSLTYETIFYIVKYFKKMNDFLFFNIFISFL